MTVPGAKTIPDAQTGALAVDGLTLAIGGATVVEDVGFALAPGEVLALVGESGCGKSLTAQAIMRLLPQAVRQVRGRVTLEGDVISELPERRMRRLRGRRIAMIFQEPQAALDALATIGTQVAENTGRPLRRVRDEVRNMLADVGISDPARRIDQFPFELSGGMCQRAMIASALIDRPPVLIADEPTTALDVTIQAQILDLLRRLAAERGTAILLITHDMGVVADIADRVAVMYAGRIVEEGPVADVLAHPRHPYTQGLLSSTVHGQDRAHDIAAIPGSPPDLRRLPPGCSFAPRCAYAIGACREAVPVPVTPAPGRMARCIRVEEFA
jgi:oligopeptide/dipeptide ABC transporter ATP-binding protein